MYGCDSWTIKKAEHWRIDAFKLWCWRRFLRVPWIARRSNQSILKEINRKYSLEGLILKLQYFGHLIGRANLLEKTLMLGMIEGRRKRGQQRMSWLDGITNLMDMCVSKLREMWRTGRCCVLRFMGSQSRTQLSGWATTTKNFSESVKDVNHRIKSIFFWAVWQPTPVFLPGESHRQRSLAGYCP